MTKCKQCGIIIDRDWVENPTKNYYCDILNLKHDFWEDNNMNDIDKLNLIMRVFRALDSCDSSLDLTWHFNDNDELELGVRCSDIFWWACADSQEINQSNIDLLEQTIEDVKLLIDVNDRSENVIITSVTDLFVARVRQMRPQNAAYSYYHSKLWKLFDACGPSRDENDDTDRPNLELHIKREQELSKRFQIQMEQPLTPPDYFKNINYNNWYNQLKHFIKGLIK